MGRQLKSFAGNMTAQPHQPGDAPDQPDDWPEIPEPKPVKPPRKHGWLKWLLVAIVILIILAILAAGGAYWYFHYHKASQPKRAPGTATVQPAPSKVTSNGTAQYVSNGQDLNLSFSYPSSWTVTPSSNNNPNDKPITLTSPLTTIENASGESVTGKVVVSIRPGSSDISELSSGKAIAAQDSVQFAYTKPASDQHQYSYLTFIHLAGGSDSSGGFEEVLLTGITPFTKGQAITAGTLGDLDPIIGVSFYTCATESCTDSNETPLSITNATWQNAALFKQVQTVFDSLQLN